jgi:glycosyltransferase involved in cell wall biosynthesis
LSLMYKIAILGALQQQADALSTQFKPIYVLFNDKTYIRNKDEMISSDMVIYKKYSVLNVKQEIFILRELLRDISPDIIYINGFRHLWMVGLLIREPGLLPRKPIILVTSHKSWSWQKATKRFMMALSCHIFADGIFTLATFQENWLRKLGISPLKMRTIPNAVDTKQFTPVGPRDFFADIFLENNNFPIIVNIANINQSKGQDVLIKSISLVKKEINSVRLVLMGIYSPNSPYYRYLKNLIAEFGLETNVYILRNVDHCQIPSVLRSSDISVISSWNEVCPFVLLESLSASKVTISTAVGGIPDIIKNEFNGFLVHPGNIKGLADCILKVISNPYLKMSIEKQARISAIENYSYDVIGREHKDFLTSIMRHKKKKYVV